MGIPSNNFFFSEDKLSYCS